MRGCTDSPICDQSRFRAVAITVFSALTRANHLSSDSTTVQGAISVLVRASISSTASSYWSHFSRFRQSSSVILYTFLGSDARSLNRLSCSSLLISSQNLTIPPFEEVTKSSSISLISWYARCHAGSGVIFSTRSTSTLPYQLRSKTAMSPPGGKYLMNRRR